MQKSGIPFHTDSLSLNEVYGLAQWNSFHEEWAAIGFAIQEPKQPLSEVANNGEKEVF